MLSDLYSFGSHELGLQRRLAINQEEFNNFFHILAQLVERIRLAVSSWESGNVTDVQTSVSALLNYVIEALHTVQRYHLPKRPSIF